MRKSLVVSVVFTALVVALSAQARADVYLDYNGAGVPEICAPVLAKDKLAFPKIEPGYVMVRPSKCKIDFEYLGTDEKGNWIVKTRKSEPTSYEVAPGAMAVLTKDKNAAWIVDIQTPDKISKEILEKAVVVFETAPGGGRQVTVPSAGSPPQVVPAGGAAVVTLDDMGNWVLTTTDTAAALPETVTAETVVFGPGKNDAWKIDIHEPWHLPPGETIVLKKLDEDALKDVKPGDMFIRPNLYILDLQYAGWTSNDKWVMTVLNNYSELGAPVPGDALLTYDSGGKLVIADGLLKFDAQWPLKALRSIDYWVVGVYLVLMIVIGFIVAGRNRNASDYFQGGGHIPWWLAGVSLFMSCFSTYTFVGGAGMAFERVFAALISYFANLSAYVLGYFILAARWRRTRSLTTMQYLEERYDNPTHQLFSWTDVIIGFFYAATQLLSLVAITGGAMGLSHGEMYWAILIIGLAILFYTVVGGLWAVVMTDMLQAVVLMPIILVVAFVCLRDVGGFGAIAANPPAHFWDFTSPSFPAALIAVNIITMLFAFSSGGAAQRYFAVRNESGARKVAVLTGILSIIGPLIWLTPPMVASWLYQHHDMTMVRLIPSFPIRESSYILMCRRILPTGLIGLILAAMFAATMSSIDTSFNFRGAILSRDILKKYLFPKMSDKALLVLGRFITAFIGLIVIGLCAIMYRYGKSMFMIMFTLGGKILLPGGIPIVFGLLFKNTKRWTGFACLLVGLLLGLVEFVLTLLHNLGWIAVDINRYAFMKEEWQILWIGAIVLAIYFVPGWISPYKDPAYQSRLDAFWKKLHTPINEAEELGPSTAGVSTFTLTGVLTVLIGLGVLVLYYWSPDRLTLWTAGITIIFGAFMWLAGSFARVKE